MLKKILPKVQQTQMAAGENWKKWSNFKRPEDPLNLVQIKNPSGSFMYNPQAYAWWVPPFFSMKILNLETPYYGPWLEEWILSILTRIPFILPRVWTNILYDHVSYCLLVKSEQ